MSEKIERLRATLAELHDELSSLPESDPEVRALLEGAVGELRAALDQHGTSLPGSLPQQQQATILGQLRDAVLRYQESHPALAASAGSVLDVLGRMGL